MKHKPNQHTDNNTHPVIQMTANELNNRLNAVLTQPQSIVLMGADSFASAHLLQNRYPQTKILEIDPDKTLLEQSHQNAKQKLNLWQKLRQVYPEQKQQPFDTSLQPDGTDTLWSNLALHRTNKAQNTLTHWLHNLKSEGMFFSATFGPDTLQELVPLLQSHEITINREKLWDMHDLGDMLACAGFTDPVTDMSKLTLTYRQPETFWSDMMQLRLWDAFVVNAPIDAYQHLVNKAIQQQQLHQITLEIVYAHAVKLTKPIINEQTIKFHPKNTC